MAIEDAIRELTEAVKGSDESPESEVTYIEAPTNPSDGDTLTYDATSGKWLAGVPQGGGLQLYGPYMAFNGQSVTIYGGTTNTVTFDSIVDTSNQPVVRPSGMYFTPLISVIHDDAHVNCPLYDISSSGMTVGNIGSSDITTDAGGFGVVFFSTVEFEPYDDSDDLDY